MAVRRYDGCGSFPRTPGGSLVAIGNFDGVHAGHRAMLGAAAADAAARGLSPVVLTFDPHPAEVLGRGKQPLLTPVPRKVELLCRLSPGLSVVVEPFTLELSRMTPRAFAEELLAARLAAKVVVVGQNFRFGHGRAGDLPMLGALGAELGFTARAEALTGDDDGPFSSSRVRGAVSRGDLATAERLLGRPHALTGTVVKGDGRGRTIGVPTANLAGVDEMLPPHGVYACLVDRVHADGRAERAGTAVANVGERPTVAAGFSVEAHLHDFDGDLYGARLRLHLVERLREERRFPGLPELVAQIRRDIQLARDSATRRAADPGAGDAWF